MVVVGIVTNASVRSVLGKVGCQNKWLYSELAEKLLCVPEYLLSTCHLF